jgi:hypothetical protein
VGEGEGQSSTGNGTYGPARTYNPPSAARSNNPTPYCPPRSRCGTAAATTGASNGSRHSLGSA